MIDVKIRKSHPDAKLPERAHPSDAGMDVTAVSVEYTADYIEYNTGLQFKLPQDHVMLIFPRSSNSKKDLLLANSVGVLDSGYTGDLKLRFKRLKHHPESVYKIGDKIGQIMIIPYPQVNFQEVDRLETTDRGDNGFGSTGK